MAFCVRYSFPELIEKSELIIQLRLNTTIFKILVFSVMCGLIMTTIFNFSKQKKFIPLLIGVPLFILLDFYHSIIDAFYYFLALNLNGYLALIYPIIIVGNFLGCILFNLVMRGSIFFKENQDEYLM